MFDGTGYELTHVGDIVARTEIRDPRKAGGSSFQYVDIASVSNKTFEITASKTIPVADAPSRARKAIRKDDILFATTRPYLKSVAMVPHDLDGQICSTGFCVLRSTSRLLPEWLFYCVISDDFLRQITPLMRGANYPAVTDKDVLSARIPLPPIDEQRRIVARIKECLERVEEVESLRRASSRDMAVLRSAVFADYVDALRANHLNKSVLGDVVTDCKYGTSQKATSNGSGCPVLRMGNIQDGRLDVNDLKYVDLTDRERKKYLLQDGDILVNRTNSLELVGKSAVFPHGLAGDWVYASYLIRIRVDRSKALPEYVNAVINSRIGRNYVFRTARRAIGMVNINAREIQQIPLPLPPIREQAALISRMKDTEVLVDEMLEGFKSEEVHHLRDSILRKAFAGEL